MDGSGHNFPDSSSGEEDFRLLADNAPVMIWRSGPDKLCDWFNKPWLDFTGRTLEQSLHRNLCLCVRPARGFQHGIPAPST